VPTEIEILKGERSPWWSLGAPWAREEDGEGREKDTRDGKGQELPRGKEKVGEVIPR